MYENKTIEELIDLLEGQDDKIEELEQEVDEVKAELSDTYDSLSELYEIEDFDKESFAEKAFNAGFECADSDGSLTKFKGWLNYKMEARL